MTFIGSVFGREWIRRFGPPAIAGILIVAATLTAVIWLACDRMNTLAIRGEADVVRALISDTRNISPELPETLSTRFAIRNPRITTAPEPTEAHLATPAHGVVAWTPSRPGDRFLELVLPLAALAFSAIALSYLLILSHLLKLHRALAESRRTAAEAIKANHTKGTLLAHMSHELRTPLHTIIGFADIISARSLGPHGGSRYAAFAADIAMSGRRLLAVINGLLEMARIDNGSRALDLDSIDINEVVRGVSNTVREKAQENGLKIICSLDENLPDIVCDPRAVRQILLQLVDNSIRFTKRGGEIRLRSGIALNGRTVDITVEDTGLGIKPDLLAKLGQPFAYSGQGYAGDSSGGGTGLGLAIAKALAEMQEARLFFESEVGRGTRVTLRLRLDVLQAQDRAGSAPFAAAL